MSDTSIRYQSGYKYQLAEDYTVQLPEAVRGKYVRSSFLSLSPQGLLTIRRGYAWDGPSGPTVDTSNFMRGSLVHDALYQLIRGGFLPWSTRRVADDLLRDLCREDGMSRLRSWWVHLAVRKFGAPSARPSHNRKILEAP